MRVVYLQNVLFMEIFKRAIFCPVLCHYILHRCRNKEILLPQPQHLPLIVVILGIEELCYHLRHRLVLKRLEILSL